MQFETIVMLALLFLFLPRSSSFTHCRFSNAVELISSSVSTGLSDAGMNAIRFVGGRMVQTNGCVTGSLPRFAPMMCKLDVWDTNYQAPPTEGDALPEVD